jgi:hypothetical protein
MNEKIHDEDEQCCLEDIVHSNRVIRFYADCPDKEFPGITWSCYGAIGPVGILPQRSVAGYLAADG